jgi:hypothetical protein
MRSTHTLPAVLVLLAIAASGCGFCGTEQWVDAARSPKVIANNEMTDDQRETVKEKKILKKGEVIIWYYDASLTGNGEHANILTTKRAAMYDESGVFKVTFDKVKSVEHEMGGTSERIRIEKKSGEFIVMKFGLASDSGRLYDSLCDKVGDACKAKK